MDEEDFIGYCAYCKSKVYKHEDHVIKNKLEEEVYHIECWKQKHSVEEELDFE